MVKAVAVAGEHEADGQADSMQLTLLTGVFFIRSLLYTLTARNKLLGLVV
jgi:hypothetical protein